MSEPPLSHEPLAIVDLEPEDTSKDKSSGSAFWETAGGKRNRLAIGWPRCLRENHLAHEGLLDSRDLASYPPKAHDFYRLELEITLLPDLGCRFRAADLVFELEQQGGGELPLVLHLAPEEIKTQKVVKKIIKWEDKLSAKVPIVKALDGTLSESQSREEQIEELEVQVGSFGAGTREAGWRFQLTAARPISFSSGTLQALVVLPKAAKALGRFKIVASIEVLSTLDRWLTVLFTNRDRPSASLTYVFPASDS